MIWMSVEWWEWGKNKMDAIEWLENDMNECGMMGMSLEWDEWLLNDVNDCWMIGMTIEW